MIKSHLSALGLILMGWALVFGALACVCSHFSRKGQPEWREPWWIFAIACIAAAMMVVGFVFLFFGQESP